MFLKIAGKITCIGLLCIGHAYAEDISAYDKIPGGESLTSVSSSSLTSMDDGFDSSISDISADLSDLQSTVSDLEEYISELESSYSSSSSDSDTTSGVYVYKGKGSTSSSSKPSVTVDSVTYYYNSDMEYMIGSDCIVETATGYYYNYYTYSNSDHGTYSAQYYYYGCE